MTRVLAPVAMVKRALNLIAPLVIAFTCPSLTWAMPTMSDEFDKFQNDAPVISTTRMQQVDGFSYLFVGGFGNEFARGHYFSLNVQTLKEMGVKKADVFFPSSLVAAGDNIDDLRERILALYRSSGKRRERKPVIVIGHSMGGLRALATVLAHPELVTEGVVANIVLIQSPVGGNTLIDQRGLIGQVFAKVFSLAPSFRSLRTEGIEAIVARRIGELTESRSDLRSISKIVRYVISQKSVDDSARAFRLQALLLPHQIPNDGLVASQDMWIPGFGIILGDLYVDHLETVLGRNVPYLIDNVDVERARAFTRSLVVSLMKSRNRNNSDYRKFTERRLVSRNGATRCHQLFYSH